MNYVPSIIVTGEAKCFLTGKKYGLDRHHVIHGRGMKPLAEREGLWIWLSHDLHMDIHDKGECKYKTLENGVIKVATMTDKELQALGERAFVDAHVKAGYPRDAARDLFLQIFGRHFDYE